jgi:hypothetical protein
MKVDYQDRSIAFVARVSARNSSYRCRKLQRLKQQVGFNPRFPEFCQGVISNPRMSKAKAN